MVKVYVSAPGKIILHGEHSVVYNHKALAASINLRTTTKLTTIDHDIIIELPNLKINEKYSLIRFANLIKILDNISNNKNVVQFIQEIKRFLDLEVQYDTNGVNAISIIFYVFYWFWKTKNSNNNRDKINGLHIVVKSEFQIGCGLGSSASYVVSLVGAFLIYSRLQYENKDVYNVAQFSTVDLKLINDMSLNLEKILHGRPSGIDNAVCTYGQIILYENSQSSVLKLPSEFLFSIILVNSGVERNTKLLVESVAEFKDRHPTVVESIFTSIDQVVDEVSNILTGTDLNCKYDKLGELMIINHHLLQSINVSHPKLDEIYNYTKETGFSGKLTGAGGGGYFIILVPPQLDINKYNELISKLKMNGFDSKEVKLCCDGVKVDLVSEK